MTKSKPLTVKQLSIETGISIATITRAIHLGELIAVVGITGKRGRPKYFIDRASAAAFKKLYKR